MMRALKTRPKPHCVDLNPFEPGGHAMRKFIITALATAAVITLVGGSSIYAVSVQSHVHPVRTPSHQNLSGLYTGCGAYGCDLLR
jgi:hypothetical protein